jgi:hypothetical protein
VKPTRLQAALIVLLGGLAALAIATLGEQRMPARHQPVTPAADTATAEQPATPSVDLSVASNTVDPPAAHDSDMPTAVAVTTTTPPKPAAPAATAEPEHTLTTVTENGTTVVPKPATEPPSTTPATTRPCGPEIAGNPSC